MPLNRRAGGLADFSIDGEAVGIKKQVGTVTDTPTGAALRGAISTLLVAAPNPRDYQLAPRDAFSHALGEYLSR